MKDREDAELQERMAEVNRCLACHERLVVRTMAGITVLGALVLALLMGSLVGG